MYERAFEASAISRQAQSTLRDPPDDARLRREPATATRKFPGLFERESI